MLLSLKQHLINLLEKHPLGYRLGVLALDNFDFLLPHEKDYLAFPLLANLLKPENHCILDVGANRGHSARAFLKLLPEWQVVSFEANPLHKKRLRSISRRYPNRFNYHIGAVTNRNKGNVEIFTPMYNRIAIHSASALTQEAALAAVRDAFPKLASKFTLVESVTPTFAIDSLSLDVSMVKLDVQGGEYEVLCGMSDLIARCKPILLLEMNLNMDNVQGILKELLYEPIQFDLLNKQFIKGWSIVDIRLRNQFFIHESMLSKVT